MRKLLVTIALAILTGMVARAAQVGDTVFGFISVENRVPLSVSNDPQEVFHLVLDDGIWLVSGQCNFLSLNTPAGTMQHPVHRTALLVLTIATSLAFCSTEAIGTTVDVAIGDGGLFFSPSSVTIQPGDTVRWTFSSGGHSTTSGSPGMPNNLWDSGIRSQGAVFNHTFPSAGTFPYYCIPHGGCCGM